LRSIQNGTKIPIYGTGQNVREWIYVEDHASAILNIIEKPNHFHRIYNLSGKEMSNLKLASTILEITGVDASELEYVEDRKGHDFRYSVDDSLYRSEFGTLESSSFESRLEETIDWYFDNTEWVARSTKRLSL
jgi:dTDP-glucose 4,6-dehydratase